MNKKILASRYIQVISFVIILMLILCIRLFVLTVVQEEKWAEAAKNQNTKEVLLSAPRGQIFDRYGRVLAGNKQIFTVTFNASGLSTEQINASAYKTIRLLEKNGDTYVDNFPIKITKKGKFYYTYDSSFILMGTTLRMFDFLVPMTVLIPPTDIGFVRFHFTLQC